ncbi:MAG: hypothetical protein ACXADY_24625 [Candidatus Hodarchaeales archaeon]|jgi:hypothetical protein
MVSKRETWKRFIRVILTQVPKYIDNYSTSEQELLSKFLVVLQNYEADTSEARRKFIENWNIYKKEFIMPTTLNYTNDYSSMPFLWFVESYFERATELLDVALFHADEFFEYLAKHLRGSSETGGFFQLVRNCTPLTDNKWENLQYESIKLTVPLTLEEVHVLEQCYSYVREAGISAFNPRNLRTAITKEVKTPKISKKIPQLLERVHAMVGLSWYYPAFDLARVYVNFQLSESTSSIEDIVDFNDPENRVLRCSDLYKVRDYKNLYLGVMVVPSHLVDSLTTYLQECEHSGKLILHECTMVEVDHMSSSLNYYDPGKGWHEWTLLEYARLIEQLKGKKKRGKKREKADTSLHMTSFVDSWHYSESPKHNQLITLFCNEKIHPYLRFRELPPKITKIEKDLLRELHKNQVVNVVFSPYHIVRDYSWDTYWISVPRPYKLTRLLTCTPYAMIYSNENSYHIWVHLTPALAQWLKRELNWSVMTISQYFYRKFPKVEDYDFNMLEWKTPKVLEVYE